MLFEAAPAWILLAALAVAHGYERSGPVLRVAVGVAVATALLVATPLAVARVRSRAWDAETLSRIVVPEDAAGALVFVHAPWDERIASTLQATGMRADSIQPLLRRNDTCALHLYARARLADGLADVADDELADVASTRLDDGLVAVPDSVPRRTGGVASLPVDLRQTSDPAEGSIAVQLEGGTRVRVRDGAVWPPACAREAAADRFGSVALAPLLWQGDLPGLEAGRPMFVRDHGPERNADVRAAFPHRPALVWGYESGGGAPALMPYDRGMALLWGSGP
jgi:hypothetical protein